MRVIDPRNVETYKTTKTALRKAESIYRSCVGLPGCMTESEFEQKCAEHKAFLSELARNIGLNDE